MLAMQFKTKLTSTIISTTLIIINKNNNNNTKDECLPERIVVGRLHPFRELQPHCEESVVCCFLFSARKLAFGQKTGILQKTGIHHNVHITHKGVKPKFMNTYVL